MKIEKKTASIIMILALAMSLAAPVLAATTADKLNNVTVYYVVTANKTDSTVRVNGEEIKFDAYNINGSNYFKLRDLSMVLSKTDKKFNVTWDNTKRAINLISGTVYSAVGGEMTSGDGKTKTAVLNACDVFKDGALVKLTSYNIEGNNYFKLRDIGMAFNFCVTWDSETNTIAMDTSKEYIKEKTTIWLKETEKKVLSGTPANPYHPSVEYDFKLTYDENGRISSSYSEIFGVDKINQQYTYDKDGILSSIVSDEYGTYYSLDERGNIVSHKYVNILGNNCESKYTYDSYGRVIADKSIRDGEEVSTTYYAYDAEGRIISEKYISDGEDGGTKSYTYDVQGNLIKMVTPPEYGWPSKIEKYTYTYDNAGRISERHSHSVQGDDKNEYITRYTYDSNGNLTQTKDDFGIATQYVRDEKDNWVKENYENCQVTTYTYIPFVQYK